jgi:hypothetical protein
MFTRYRKYILLIVLTVTALLFLFQKTLYACGGKDVILLNPSSEDYSFRNDQLDEHGFISVDQSRISISPLLAQTIAEKFLIENFADPPLPLIFRKLESVHRKLIYQFQSEPVENYSGDYHLGPVNFRVESLVLDVSARPASLYV